MAMISDSDKPYNMFKMVELQLEREVKKAVTEEIVKEQMKLFESEIREKIKPIVEKITFIKIANMTEFMKAREEFYVYLSLDGEVKSKVINEGVRP